MRERLRRRHRSLTDRVGCEVTRRCRRVLLSGSVGQFYGTRRRRRSKRAACCFAAGPSADIRAGDRDRRQRRQGASFRQHDAVAAAGVADRQPLAAVAAHRRVAQHAARGARRDGAGRVRSGPDCQHASRISFRQPNARSRSRGYWTCRKKPRPIPRPRVPFMPSHMPVRRWLLPASSAGISISTRGISSIECCMLHSDRD